MNMGLRRLKRLSVNDLLYFLGIKKKGSDVIRDLHLSEKSSTAAVYKTAYENVQTICRQRMIEFLYLNTHNSIVCNT